MKLTAVLIFTLTVPLFTSCESVDSRRAGGAAFDDSQLARKLDANAPVDHEDPSESRSFSAWRSTDPSLR